VGPSRGDPLSGEVKKNGYNITRYRAMFRVKELVCWLVLSIWALAISDRRGYGLDKGHCLSQMYSRFRFRLCVGFLTFDPRGFSHFFVWRHWA
jgi:hypothetical protein